MALSSSISNYTRIATTRLPSRLISSASSAAASAPHFRSKNITAAAAAAASTAGVPPPQQLKNQAPAPAQQASRLHEDHRKQHGDNIAIPAAATSSYTSMRADPLAFWDTHQGLLHHHNNGDHIADQEEEGAVLLAAELRLLANVASDRAEMHSILAQQRDNWNKLFQRMLTSASMTACVLGALGGQVGHSAGLSLSLSLPALLLNAGSAAMMAVINQFQPSQLAEEQRTAARLFRKLASDVHYTLNVPPHLRQSVSSFLYDCKRRLRALEKAFPMPLTPGGLEKFPAKVVPPVLIEPRLTDQAAGSDNENSHNIVNDGIFNGWDLQLTHDLEHVATMLRRSDIPKYIGWAQNLAKVNKCLAIAAPCLAGIAALLNALVIINTTILPSTNILCMWAASCSVLASLAGSFSNDMQLGMVFELYRNSAGYYADVEVSIKETLRMPVEERENGALFRQRIAYQLGRHHEGHLLPADAKEAGTLF